MSEIENTLRNVEFFQDLDREHLQRLAAISQIVEFPAHYDIFREDGPARDVYVVVSGRVSLVVCTPKVGCRQLMEVGPGELIGWSPVVGRSRLTDTARTVTPTKVIAIEGKSILKVCREDTRFGFDFIQRVAQTLALRLSATRLQLLELSGVHLPKVQLESD